MMPALAHRVVAAAPAAAPRVRQAAHMPVRPPTQLAPHHATGASNIVVAPATAHLAALEAAAAKPAAAPAAPPAQVAPAGTPDARQKVHTMLAAWDRFQ